MRSTLLLKIPEVLSSANVTVGADNAANVSQITHRRCIVMLLTSTTLLMQINSYLPPRNGLLLFRFRLVNQVTTSRDQVPAP